MTTHCLDINRARSYDMLSKFEEYVQPENHTLFSSGIIINANSYIDDTSTETLYKII